MRHFKLPARIIRYGVFKVRQCTFNLFYGTRKMSDLEYLVCEDGLRVIPHVTHNRVQCERHCQRYEFARKLIEQDARGFPVSILDLGSGAGYGAKVLSHVPNSTVYGVDISPYAISYSNQTYGGDNVLFEVADIVEYVKTMPEFDYIVSCHVIEHLVNGLSIVSQLKFRRKAIIATPYNEQAGANHNHVLLNITEQSFNCYPDKEFYYDDYWGKIHAEKPKHIFFSMICVILGKTTIQPG